MCGLSPNLITLKNNSSEFLVDFLEHDDISVKLVPPHLHHRNTIERAISIFKCQFVAVLCDCDPHFLVKVWYILLQQTVLTFKFTSFFLGLIITFLRMLKHGARLAMIALLQHLKALAHSYMKNQLFVNHGRPMLLEDGI